VAQREFDGERHDDGLGGATDAAVHPTLTGDLRLIRKPSLRITSDTCHRGGGVSYETTP
jgi:hypothetical protein